MVFNVISGIIIPFLGTVLGAMCVFVPGKKSSENLNRNMMGFAAGVMVAASVWSLIIPAVNFSIGLGIWSFAPVCIGFWIGVLFIHFLEKSDCNIEKKDMFFWAVLLHNIPEGMAVGVVYAGVMTGESDTLLWSALLLSTGIAIQNFPEGAIVSLPLVARGEKKITALKKGVLSGIVEPVGAVIALVAVTIITPLMPYVLGFAAGAMIYVVLEELMPKFTGECNLSSGNLSFCLGFNIMMILDIVLS